MNTIAPIITVVLLMSPLVLVGVYGLIKTKKEYIQDDV